VLNLLTVKENVGPSSIDFSKSCRVLDLKISSSSASFPPAPSAPLY